MVTAIHHVGIVVRKLGEAYRFWRDTLGLPLVREAEIADQGVRAALLAAGDSEIELLEPTDADSGIARFLDRLHPEPPLFPADPERRATVEEAERWGEDEFQMIARRVVLAGSLHGRDGLIDRGADGRLGPLLWRNDSVRLVASRGLCRFRFDVNPATERELLDSLPVALDRIDAWIEAGVLNGAELNVADFLIGSNLALLCYRADLRAEVEGRPAGELVERVFEVEGAR